MAELKTKPTTQSVTEFLRTVKDERRRKDCTVIVKLMKEVTGSKPVMWGSSIVGFGSYHYASTSGREGDWFLTGFSPRKQALTIYTMGGLKSSDDLLAKLGKVKTSGSCIYIKSLEDVDLTILKTLIARAVKKLKQKS